jgi:hypothetical protein
MGYVGEAVVCQWLRHKYPAEDGYEVVSQVKPLGVRAKGGPYLDFGVVKGSNLIALYEVKSQDYILDKSFNLNSSLLYAWSHRGEALEFASQDGRTFRGSTETEAYLVLLVGPNEGAIANIGEANLPNILLFSELWADTGWDVDRDGLLAEIAEDIPKVLGILKSPTQGKLINKRFLAMKSGTP